MFTHMLTIEDIMVDAPPLEMVIQPMDWFTNPGPFELEIGPGKGSFLLHRARSHPEIRFLGIEWANKYFTFAADRMARWGLTNVRMMRTDADLFVRHNLPPRCLSCLHLYHPDPWPKKRHHKRRIVQPPFIAAVLNAFIPGATWRVQHDHQEYFEWMCERLDNTAGLVRIGWHDDGVVDDTWMGTNFEIKHARDGKEIHRAVWRYLPNE